MPSLLWRASAQLSSVVDVLDQSYRAEEAAGRGGCHRLLSSSFLGLPYRILNMKPQKGTT